MPNCCLALVTPATMTTSAGLLRVGILLLPISVTTKSAARVLRRPLGTPKHWIWLAFVQGSRSSVRLAYSTSGRNFPISLTPSSARVVSASMNFAHPNLPMLEKAVATPMIVKPIAAESPTLKDIGTVRQFAATPRSLNCMTRQTTSISNFVHNPLRMDKDAHLLTLMNGLVTLFPRMTYAKACTVTYLMAFVSFQEIPK